MAEVSKTGVPTPCNPLAVQQHSITGLYAGELIAGGDAVYIKESDGLVYKTSGAAATEPARCRGFAAKVASVGEAVTILRDGVHVAYGPNTTGVPTPAGRSLFLSGTVAGGLADTASVGGTTAVAFVIDTDGRIEIDIR